MSILQDVHVLYQLVNPDFFHSTLQGCAPTGRESTYVENRDCSQPTPPTTPSAQEVDCLIMGQFQVVCTPNILDLKLRANAPEHGWFFLGFPDLFSGRLGVFC